MREVEKEAVSGMIGASIDEVNGHHETGALESGKRSPPRVEHA